MLQQTTVVDRAGRIVLPKPVLDALGMHPGEKVTLYVTDEGVMIKPGQAAVPVTERIAAMDLPVADWETMELETELGRLSS